MVMVDVLLYKEHKTVWSFDLQELCLQTMAAISEQSTSKKLRISFSILEVISQTFYLWHL